MIKDAGFQKRFKNSANDFWLGVRPALEKHCNGKIITVEQRPRDLLINSMDFNGVDAFILDQQGRLQGLGSRVNWKWFKKSPAFSFRYELWDEKNNNWKNNREFHKKLELANENGSYMFPVLHVEAFSNLEGSGQIRWAYVAQTKDLVNYINTYVDHERRTIKSNKGIEIKPPKNDESRLVVCVNVDIFKHVHDVKEIITAVA